MHNFRYPISCALVAWLSLAAFALVPRTVSAGNFSVRLVEVNASLTIGGTGDHPASYDSGYLSQTSISHTQGSNYSESAGIYGSMSASTTTTATASLGHLGGLAFATADSEGLNAHSQAYEQLYANDTFTATGPVQADGHIHLPYSFTINDAITPSGNHVPSDSASAEFIDSVSGAVSFSLDVTDSTASHYTGPQTFSGFFVLLPGQQFVVNSTLFINATPNSAGGPATYTLDATHSLDFHLYNDPISGGSYTTDSGVSYATATPEPSTFVLAALGLVSMGFVAISRRSRH